MIESQAPLPPGQFELHQFPRFGLGRFAKSFAPDPFKLQISIGGEVEHSLIVTRQSLHLLPRIEQISDFHCVTTWTCRDLHWRGVRFTDFYRSIVEVAARPHALANVVVFRAADGYCTCLPLDDLLAKEVLLADQLQGEPLGLAHGAPLRLVAPAHYGYKNIKHLEAIEFRRDRKAYRFPKPYPKFMDHPRARVEFEERGIGIPGWLLRRFYRPLIGPTIRNFRRALEARLRADNN